jgi:hypothetical protein
MFGKKCLRSREERAKSYLNQASFDSLHKAKHDLDLVERERKANRFVPPPDILHIFN